MNLHKRVTSVMARALNDDDFLLHAHLEDEVHIMDVQLVCRVDNGLILSAYATMGKVPYPETCPKVLSLVDRVVGLRIERGVSHAIRQAVGGPQGCTHLSDLVIEACRAYIPSIGRREMVNLEQTYREMGLDEAEIERRVMAEIYRLGSVLLPDSCLVYARDKTAVSQREEE
ncbi:MAG: DUF2889 domain-containing protein [Bacillota bacterium]